MKGKVIKGEKYNYWTAIEPVENRNSIDEMWLCECRCGRKRVMTLFRLISYRDGKEYYNGCGYCENERFRGHPRIIVDGKRIPVYGAWCNMKKRCYDPNCRNYKYYGGRGITIYEEWRSSFLSFYNYVSKLEHYGEPGRSLDRINNDKGYYPGNVRWATAKEQANNQRKRKKRCENGGKIDGSTEKSNKEV